jgi:division protein CdvB (Snf7/Vps24/ESCRT-III family)
MQIEKINETEMRVVQDNGYEKVFNIPYLLSQTQAILKQMESEYTQRNHEWNEVLSYLAVFSEEEINSAMQKISDEDGLIINPVYTV